MGKYFHKNAFLFSKHFDALIRYQLNFLEKKKVCLWSKECPLRYEEGGCYGGGGMQFYDVSGPHFVPTRSCSAVQPKVKLHQSQLLCGGQIENMWIVRWLLLTQKTFIPTEGPKKNRLIIVGFVFDREAFFSYKCKAVVLPSPNERTRDALKDAAAQQCLSAVQHIHPLPAACRMHPKCIQQRKWNGIVD